MITVPSPLFDPSNTFLAPMVEVLRRHPKRIVFPSGLDPRVLRVAAELVKLEAVAPVLLGHRPSIRAMAAELGISMEFIGVIDPVDSDDFDFFCERYRRVEKARHRQVRDPREVMIKPAYFAAMMVQYGYADGIVGGERRFSGGILPGALPFDPPTARQGQCVVLPASLVAPTT